MSKKTESKTGIWRKPTLAEQKKYLAAFEKTFGKVGRPALDVTVKKKSIHIKLDPEVIAKFKAKAKKSGKPYQTLINEALRKVA